MAYSNSFQKELLFGKEIALKAGELMLRFSEGDQQKHMKEDTTPVTIADTMINDMIIAEIAKQFPEDIVVGEEKSTGSYGMGRRWVCDPIDGTAAYTIGLPSSMFSIALVVDGKPRVAVAYEPHRKQLYTAAAGQGSYCNDLKLVVSRERMDEALIGLAPDYIRPQFINESFMKKLLAYDKQLAIFPGAVFRSCMVASGRIAGFPHPRVKPYDIAAVHLIVEEAGGKVTDTKGQIISYLKEFRGAVISNGVIHEDLLALFT
ncbi:MAG: inositol monophosphatase [Patescibacteria group bacterium]|nr:inositol monophosphatase [Patescibacteria group bacterium]MDE2590607.1 inositol monophosphatase [Patescibacteria group bacterium]